jgi:hypothetical protein
MRVIEGVVVVVVGFTACRSVGVGGRVNMMFMWPAPPPTPPTSPPRPNAGGIIMFMLLVPRLLWWWRQR